MEAALVSLAALVFFFAVRWLISQLVKGRGWFETLQAQPRELWLNSAASLSHALVSGAGASLLVYWWPNIASDPFEADNHGTRTIVAISNGYFIYDLIDIFQHRLFMKGSQWLIYAHHVVVIFCFSMALNENTLTAYLSLNLVCEVNNWFLHGGKVLRKTGLAATSTICRLNDVLFLITAAVFRFAPHFWIQYKLVEDYNKFSNGLHFGIAFSGMIAINILNVMLIRDFFISRARGPKRSE
eukprot:m.240755 g.240755  ORF g.240755 m.240755 type:complete len:241 (-) comp23628_c0_seq1:32-754(-)